MPAKRSFLALLAAVSTAVVALAAASPALPAAATGALRICTGCAAASGDLSQFSYVILHSWDHERIPALKAANPAIKVLVYKNMSATYEYAVKDGRDQPYLPAGVGYAWASANRPDWFLRDTQGQMIEFADFPQLWLMDVGSTSYQEAWLSNVAFELRTHGWDGVMIDDTNVSARYHVGPGKTIAKYPTDAAYAAATRSFLARVGPALQAQGRLVIPNVFAEWPDAPQVWRDWLQFTSGAVQEYWTKWGFGAGEHFGERDWLYRQQFLSITQEMKKIFLGITYAPPDDVRSMRYARASFLLDWDGGAGALIFEPWANQAHPPFSPDWTTDIGRPLEPRREVGGVLRRNYSGGVVLANISNDVPRTIALGRPYFAPDGTRIRSVRLEPKSGVVLRMVAPLSTFADPAPSAERHDATSLAARVAKRIRGRIPAVKPPRFRR
jgi:hypothetical protein